MAERYATIILNDDGEEVVSAIAQIEGAAPEPKADNARIEKVGPDVLIGMVRGGTVDAVDGFGFTDGSQGADGRAGTFGAKEKASKKTGKAKA